jgi:hypothetical protein
MGLINRFFGRRARKTDEASRLVANPDDRDALSLQLLFTSPLDLEAGKLTKSLRSYHPSLKDALVELDADTAAQGTPIGLAGWGDHVIRLVGFNVPMPSEVVERCVAPSHYGPELKEKARKHQAHMLLSYAGRESSRLEQYVAVAVLAGVLASHGALVILNESAHTSFPAAALSADPSEGDTLEQLRSLPLLILFCGFVKYEVEGIPGVWMRTYGAHLLGLPDLATLAQGHHEGEKYFELFGNIFTYLLNSGARFDVGHTMQVGSDTFMRLRAPTKEEYFLQSEGELFVAEMIGADEINRG